MQDSLHCFYEHHKESLVSERKTLFGSELFVSDPLMLSKRSSETLCMLITSSLMRVMQKLLRRAIFHSSCEVWFVLRLAWHKRNPTRTNALSATIIFQTHPKIFAQVNDEILNKTSQTPVAGVICASAITRLTSECRQLHQNLLRPPHLMLIDVKPGLTGDPPFHHLH